MNLNYHGVPMALVLSDYENQERLIMESVIMEKQNLVTGQEVRKGSCERYPDGIVIKPKVYENGVAYSVNNFYAGYDLYPNLSYATLIVEFGKDISFIITKLNPFLEKYENQYAKERIDKNRKVQEELLSNLGEEIKPEDKEFQPHIMESVRILQEFQSKNNREIKRPKTKTR